VKEGTFDSHRVLNGWVEKLNQSLANGYDGLRLSGNTCWLKNEDWNDFVDYEEEVDRVFGNYQIIALCAYCFNRCSAPEIIDVVTNHQFALIKRDGKWEQIESSKRKEEETVILQFLRRKEAEQERKQAEKVLHEAYTKLQVQSEELKAQSEEFQIQYEESQVQSEEIQAQNEELQAQSEEIQVQNLELHAQSEELHEAYKLLNESEKHFRTLAENSPDIIARFDKRNRHLYVNPASVELYSCSQERIIGKTHTELGMDSELVKFWERHYENVFTTGKPETMEFQYTSPDGKEYYFNT
jgi:PAS domain S-box-containing protein